MRKSQVKELLFENFSKEVSSAVEECKALKERLDGRICQLLSKYGDMVLEILRDEGLVPPPQATAEPQEDATKKRGKKTSRKRRTTPLVNSLKKFVPAVVQTLGTGGKEFTAKEAHQYLVKKCKVSNELTSAYVSLYLSKNEKDLDLASEKRKVPEHHLPVRFFKLAKPAKKK